VISFANLIMVATNFQKYYPPLRHTFFRISLERIGSKCIGLRSTSIQIVQIDKKGLLLCVVKREAIFVGFFFFLSTALTNNCLGY
jgi:hypothetical protein